MVFTARQRELEKHYTQGEALQRKALSRLLQRAADTEFGRQYGKELTPKQLKMLRAFVGLRKKSRPAKIFTILRYGFTFNRLHRTAGECLFL